jgi:hypothetical protein
MVAMGIVLRDAVEDALVLGELALDGLYQVSCQWQLLRRCLAAI